MPIVTIQTVADYAQVSKTTVSRVLNNNPRVNTDIRERVLAAVQALGYEPNRAARRLRKQASEVIGVIISDIQNPHFTSIIRGLEDAAYEVQMNIVLCNSDEDSTKLQQYLRVMQAEGVAGLIVVPNHAAHDHRALEMLQQDGLPIILLDRSIPDMQADAVLVSNQQGAYEAVRHLIGLGRRRIAIVYPDVLTGYERYQGYRQALAEAHLVEDGALVKVADVRTDSAYRLTGEIMADQQKPDAIFTATNLMTLGALRTLRELRLSIPTDVALVGFDDMPWAEELVVPLTAVAQPTYELGQQAVHLLRRRLEAPDGPFETVVLPTTLIIRESCGASLPRD